MAVELRHAIFQLHAEVGVPEEARVGEPGPHHALVAGHDDGAPVGGHDVGHQDETVGERAVGPSGDEALLVGADGGADHLGGDAEEGRVEAAHHDDRPFDEARHFGQQRLVLDDLQPRREGEIAGVVADDVGAASGVEHDLRGLQRRNVVVEAPHPDGGRSHEAVAARLVARGDAADRKAHNLGVLGLGAEDAQDRLQRPHPAQRVGVRRGPPPAHALRPREAVDQAGHQAGDDVGGGLPRPVDVGHVGGALPVLDDLGFRDRRQAGALQEPRDGRLGRADARAAPLLVGVGLAGRKAGHLQGEAARRHEGFGALVEQARRHQGVGDEALQVGGRPRLHAGGDLFGEQFEQEVGHGCLREGGSDAPDGTGVAQDRGVGGEQRDAFDRGLRDEQAVEGVLMDPG